MSSSSGEEKHANENSRNMDLVDSTREEINIIFKEIIKAYNDFVKDHKKKKHTTRDIEDMTDNILKIAKKGIHDKMTIIYKRSQEAQENKTRILTNKTEPLIKKTQALMDYYYNRIVPTILQMKHGFREMKKDTTNNIINHFGRMSFKNKNNHKTEGGKRRRHPTKKRRTRKQ